MEVFHTSKGQALSVLSLLGLLLCLSPVVSGVVDVTITSKFPYYPDDDYTWLYCYYTGRHINQRGYLFGLELDTGSGQEFTKARNTYRNPRRVRVWHYDTRNNVPVHLTNAISCIGQQNGVSDKVITLKMREDADVKPRLFSRTVNVEDDPVTLEMVRNPDSTRTGDLEWRKDGVVLQGQRSLTLNINSVQSSDEGIYECYYRGAYTDRKQGIMRLIVRACAGNKYGPPGCSSDCPACYNGGVCHDQTGECVCPPGFMGTHCETACPSGRFGKTCSFSCSGGCQGQLMTVPDPVGCTCPPGLTGMTCQDACPEDTYGASCTQTCHCLSGPLACNSETGACTGGCAAGWIGDSCQIRPPTITQHPTNQTVDVEHQATFTCSSQGVPTPKIIWYNDSSTITPGGQISVDVITGKVNGIDVVTSTLTITSVDREDNGEYKCTSSNAAGDDTSQVATLTVQERPDDVNVTVTAVNSTALQVTWTVGVSGNLDIINSQVRYRSYINGEWTPHSPWRLTGISGTNGAVHISGLLPAVTYLVQFSVQNAIGWNRPPAWARGITDEAPPGTPLGLQATPTSHNTVQLSWQPPVRTNGVIRSYTVQYKASLSCNSSDFSHGVSTTDDSTTTVIGDLVPYTNYIFRVRGATSAGGGDFSNCNTTRTLEYYPTAPVILKVEDERDCNCDGSNVARQVALTIKFRRPDNVYGQLQAYQVSLYNRSTNEPFHRENMTSGLQQENLTVIVSSEQLQPAQNYSVTVSAINTVYRGIESHPRVAQTSDGCPDAPTVESQVTDDNCGLMWTPPSQSRGIITGHSVTRTVIPRHQYPDDSNAEVTKETFDLGVHQWSALKQNLSANSVIHFTVRALTCGEGGKSEELTCEATRFEPPAVMLLSTGPPVIPTARSFHMDLPDVSERNGPISCYQVIVVKMKKDETLEGLGRRVGAPDVILTDEAPQEGQTEPYVALGLSGEQYKQIVAHGVDIGTGEACEHECCRRSEVTLKGGNAKDPGNKELEPETKYTAVIRVYVDTSTSGGRRKRDTRRAYSTSPFIEPVVTQDVVTTAVIPIAVGAAVGVLLALVVALGILLYRRRTARKKVPATLPLTPVVTADEEKDELRGAVGPQVDTEEEVAVTPKPKPKPRPPKLAKKPSAPPPVQKPNFDEPIAISNLEAEFDRRAANGNQLFSEEFSALPATLGREHAEAYYSDFNTERNRFKNIIAYDNARVQLTPIPDSPGSDYIHASYMDGYSVARKFIAAQGPLPNTVGDFWRMMWETGSKTIVMVTNLKEKNKQKCTQYWPDSGKQTYGDIDVTLVDTIPMVDLVTRIFLVTKEGVHGRRQVTQFHFLGWPDYGLPRSPMGLLKFHRTVATKTTSKDTPIVVHCSAGVGRTGTFITIDAMLEMMQTEEKVDVFGFVSRMRQNRSNMVQTEAQYVFIYRALLEQYLYGNTEVEVANIQHHMHKLRTEQPGADKTGFEIEFEKLTRLPVDRANMRCGNLPNNMNKNRVLQILPYDTRRVFLKHKLGVKGSDYINASFIDGYREKDAYIATQGPLDRTVEDFWRMVWEWNSCSIVMLTELKEKGSSKSAHYWPEEGQLQTFGEVVVTAQGVETLSDYDLRTFNVCHTKGDETRTVQQFHFHGWPEVGVPDNAAGMIDLIGQVQKQQQQSGNGPITVHCSSGSGRTGTFCAISTVLERVKAEGICDVFQVVKALRQQRPHMVQTLDQYQFCYQAVVEYLDSFDTYANFR
ncbi:PTPRA [Branchiostoma lanceolatum]|uniref:protein-tyrosine-phosphatase n=1 Tax=Branchiostoma lanceolatum TaxID=7740 RepID=A0A8K0E7H7_BRALA|nr:PTPRA [Branchiostoma lanceolatum]CAH1243539.1 PTPRA [Branchiostoma lanceolatum]